MKETLNAFNGFLNETKLFGTYPELKNEIDKYSRLLSQSSTLIQQKTGTKFEIPIRTGIKNEIYTLEWNIDKVTEYVKENNIQSKELKVNTPMIWSCPSRLNYSKLAHYRQTIKTIEEPIILAYHAPVNLLVVIDGNHRFHLARERNQEKIKAIILHPSTHISFLLNDYQKNIYKIHHNIVTLHHYSCVPKQRTCDLNKNLEPYSFYPLTDTKYKFNKYRRLKYIVHSVLNKQS